MLEAFSMEDVNAWQFTDCIPSVSNCAEAASVLTLTITFLQYPLLGEISGLELLYLNLI